jgi:hypothetical protein
MQKPMTLAGFQTAEQTKRALRAGRKILGVLCRRMGTL